jgi:hypothetical protein
VEVPRKPNKPVMIVLGLTLVGVWGAIGFQIFAAMNVSPEQEERVRLIKPGRDSVYVYVADSRDPFFSPPPKPKPIGKAIVPEIPWTPPKLKLTGVLSSGHQLSAVLEDSTGNISLLSPGETLNGVKILNVSARKVLYSYMKRNNEWILEGE